MAITALQGGGQIHITFCMDPFPRESQQGVVVWVDEALIYAQLFEGVPEEDIGGAALIYENLVYPPVGYGGGDDYGVVQTGLWLSRDVVVVGESDRRIGRWWCQADVVDLALVLFFLGTGCSPSSKSAGDGMYTPNGLGRVVWLDYLTAYLWRLYDHGGGRSWGVLLDCWSYGLSSASSTVEWTSSAPPSVAPASSPAAVWLLSETRKGS